MLPPRGAGLPAASRHRVALPHADVRTTRAFCSSDTIGTSPVQRREGLATATSAQSPGSSPGRAGTFFPGKESVAFVRGPGRPGLQ